MSILVKRSAAIALFCVASFVLVAFRANAQQITWQVIGAGATMTTNGPIALMGTVGQTAIGTLEGGTTTAHLGFWVPQTKTTTGVPSPGEPADQAGLKNFPNPFTTTTTIFYALDQRSEVHLRVFDLSGQLVKELVAGIVEGGASEVVWNGTNDRGEEVSSGTYYYKLDAQPVDGSAKAISQRGKMLLMR